MHSSPLATPATAAPPASGRARSGTVIGLLALCGVLLGSPPASATVAEQRARLPPPAECQDPIAGIWRAHHFVTQYGTWYLRTLEIHRVAEGQPKLTGLVWADYWYGTAQDQEAPQCRAGSGYHAVIRMPAEGTYQDGEVKFGGTSWSLERLVCGRSGNGYNPDRFTGRLDPALQEFQSVNNDGGTAVNEPVVFRRVQCFDTPAGAAAAAPSVAVAPPPLFSSKRTGSCHCSFEPSRPDTSVGAFLLGLVCALGRRLGPRHRRETPRYRLRPARRRR